MRSSTPPCPGISDELSFTPAARFSRDSNRSPQMPETDDEHAEHEQRTVAGNGSIVAPANDHERGAEDDAADRAFDGLLRADRRRQRPSAEHAARVVLRRVADDHRRRAAAASPASPEAPCTATSMPSGMPM